MEENDFVERLIFCDEATFHISGKVNVHNVHIWGTEQPREKLEHQRDSSKVNVLYAVARKRRQPPSPLATPFAGSNTCDFLLWRGGGR